jgi:hypothetical protein
LLRIPTRVDPAAALLLAFFLLTVFFLTGVRFLLDFAATALSPRTRIFRFA